MDDGSLLDAVSDSLNAALKGHYTEKKRMERQRTGGRQVAHVRTHENTLKDCVFEVMEVAATKASDNFSLPYSVRQLYYQVRPLITQYTHKELNYVYFTPPLVTEYEEIHGPLQGLVYDPRGHLVEPHADVEVPLGTLQVGAYNIPDWEYDKILYVEKEGFRQIFDAVKLGQRYDMAYMTAKGFATRAAKQLLDRASSKDITILVAHDCDLSGYEIARTLEEETRTTRDLYIDVTDLGLTVKEAKGMGLQVEDIYVQKRPSYALLGKLNEEEKQFLIGTRGWGGYHGKRVELNAMTTRQLISWLEGRLKELGLQTKVLPPEDVVEKELKDTIDSKLDDDVKQMVKEAIEELLGAPISYIEYEVRKKIGMPEGNGYYEELKQFLDGCPPEYWRDWISDKATQLEEAHIEDKKSMVSKFLSQRLNKKMLENEL